MLSASSSFLVLTTYVLTSLLENRGWSAVILTVATSATSVIALTSSHARPRLVRSAIVLSGLTIALAAIAAVERRSPLAQPRLDRSRSRCSRWRWGRSCGGSSPPARSARARSSARSASTPCSASSSPSSTGRSTGSRAAPFFEGVAHPGGSDFLFFSYTTLTTTGYGNLVPGGQPGQMLAGLEMMIGQIFLVTLVAGLVSLWRPGEGLRQRQARRSQS